jgi:hypothetical protein
MTALEAAKHYMAVLRAYAYVKKQVEWRKGHIEAAKVSASSWVHEYLPTAKTSLKRNQRRLRQVGKLKTALENAMGSSRVKIKSGDVDALWPAFMDREGRCFPPWKVQEEFVGGR